MQKKVEFVVVATLTDNSFFFSAMHCDVFVLGYILEYSWSYPEPPECIRNIAIYFVLSSECDIWPAD